jgi:hypothetical protein
MGNVDNNVFTKAKEIKNRSTEPRRIFAVVLHSSDVRSLLEKEVTINGDAYKCVEVDHRGAPGKGVLACLIVKELPDGA